MGFLKNIFNKNDTDDKKSAKEWTYPDWLPEEEYPAYEACKKESLAFEESIHRYAAKPINTDLYVYCFVDNVLDKKKSTKESLERIKNEHDILMERYYELRRIPGIWNQEMPDGYDMLNESKEERGKYLLTLPGRKEYIYSCVLFDNSINEKDDNTSEMSGWSSINKSLNMRLNSLFGPGINSEPYAWYKGRDIDNQPETTSYLRDLGVAEDICRCVPIFTDHYSLGRQLWDQRWITNGWIWNSAFRREARMDENGGGSIKFTYALEDTKGYDAYMTVLNAAKEKGPGAVEMFEDELKELMRRITFSDDNLLTLFPVDVLSADETVYQLLYRMPYTGLNRQQASKMIYRLDCSVRAYTNLSDLMVRFGVPLEVMDEIPAVKIWINDDRRSGEALLECIEKGLFKDNYFEDTKYCRVSGVDRKDFDRLVKWYQTRSRDVLPPAHHIGKGAYAVTQ